MDGINRYCYDKTISTMMRKKVKEKRERLFGMMSCSSQYVKGFCNSMKHTCHVVVVVVL